MRFPLATFFRPGMAVQRMNSTLCTIGFTKKTAEEFFHLLQEAGIHKVIDVRENRIGQLSGFAKAPDLAFFLKRIAGIEYCAEPLLAPSPEIRRAYAQNRDWVQYEESFQRLMRERQVPERLQPEEFEGPVVLLCSEPGPERCHRRLVADLLSAYWNSLGHSVQVKHLLSEKPPRRRKKAAASVDGTASF